MRCFYSVMFGVLTAMVPFLGVQAEKFESNGLIYSVDGLECSVVGLVNSNVDTVSLPSHVWYAGGNIEVTGIGDEAFRYNTSLKCVNIPSSVTFIGDYAFENCTGLVNIELPTSLKVIGNSSFAYCTGLESISIPETVERIGDTAFSYCFSLVSVSIPNTVDDLGVDVFGGCSGLTKPLYTDKLFIYMPQASCPSVYEIPDGIKKICVSAFWDCENLESVTIPSSVTEIADVSFEHCTNLRSLNIPDSVVSIGRFAFAGCKRIKNIVLPNSIKSIGHGAFRSCAELESLVLPESIERISDEVFSDCYNLVSITLPESVVELGTNAFFECPKLTSVTIPSSLENVGTNAFYGCNDLCKLILKSKKLPAGLLETLPKMSNRVIYAMDDIVIDESYGHVRKLDYLDMMFEKDGLKYVPLSLSTESNCLAIDCSYMSSDTSFCINPSVNFEGVTYRLSEYGPFLMKNNKFVEKIDIKADVDNISEGFASGCSGLVKVFLNSSISSVGDSFLAGCVSLSEIHVDAVEPPVCGMDAFESVDKSECRLFVPGGTLDSYRKAEYWKDFILIDEEESTAGLDNVSEDVYEKVYNVYNMNGVLIMSTKNTDDLHTLSSGIYIIDGKKTLIE